MSKYIGDVSAYAYAVSKGYTGTEEEFAELMADYADVGQRAEDAAESALNSKTAAQTAAQTATTKAAEASTSATSASGSATAASASASQASESATQASQSATAASGSATSAATSASTATTKASEASTSATAANTAKTAAEAAQGKAETAQRAAETAAATFETDRTLTVSGKAADAKATGDEISDLKEDLSALIDEKTFSVIIDLSNVFPCEFKAGETYVISTNARQTGLRTLASDQTTTVDNIITEFKANTSVKFVPTADASYLRVWGASNGTITVVCTSARVPVLEDTVKGQDTAISNLVGNEDALSISLDDLDNGTMHIPARFVRGTILAADGSAYTDDYLYRIVTPEKIVLDHDVRIYGKANYKVSIAIFNGDGTLVEIATITTGYYIVYANTPFRVSIRKLTEDTTTPADIEELYRVPHFGSVINERITALEADRPVFYVGSSREYTTLKAITEYISENDIHNATVYVDADTYDLTSEYGSEYLDAIPSGSNVGYGLHVGNNTHYIFAEGAEIVFNYQGSNLSCADYFSPFNITGSVILENANITVQNARYCVHEDLPTTANIIPDNTTVKYINCVMKHNGRTLETTGAHSGYACIGGGCNKNTLSIIDGGKYSNVDATWIFPISYHNYDGTAKSRIILHNVWMSRGIRLAQLSTHQSIVNVEISGCYMPNGIQKTDNTDTLFNVTQWNNIGIE